MTNTKSTKRALLASVMAMLLCFTMLLGTTFAWFTDSVTSSGNKIVAGTLDVKLLMDADVDGTYDDISNSTSPIFGEGSIAQNNNAATLWEPGKTQVAYLAIQNGGNLDLKYTVGLNVQNVSKDLYEVMEYAIVADADKDAPVTSWTSGNSVVEGTQSVSGDVALKVGETHHFALVIHMNEDASSEYMGGQVNFDLTVLATQLASESDSFNNQYDKDVVIVASAADLVDAVEDGGNIALVNDIIVSESLPITKDTVIDLNGKNIGTSGSTTGSPLYLRGGKLTVKNGNLDLDGLHTNVNGTFSVAIGYDAQTELVVENVNFTGKTAINGTFATDGPLKVTVSDCTMDVTSVGIAVSANSTDAVATITNCNIDADEYAIFASQGSKITINGGTYKSVGKVITSMYDNTVVTINGGTFEGELWVTSGGSLVIYGGTFTADPSAYVAIGYQAVDNGDGTWTVTAP